MISFESAENLSAEEGESAPLDPNVSQPPTSRGLVHGDPGESELGSKKEGENVNVFCRIRPSTDWEKDRSLDLCLFSESDTEVKYLTAHSDLRFSFSKVFDVHAEQDEVYDTTARNVVDGFMRGLNGTILAYGQTTSGKTYTVQGTRSNPGILPRLGREIFRHMEHTNPSIENTLIISYVDIYQNTIFDLLDEKCRSARRIRTWGDGCVYVEDATQTTLRSEEDYLRQVDRALKNRFVAETNMSVCSSRSHSAMILTLRSRNHSTHTDVSSQLYVVDLAGSEKVSKTLAEGQRLEEAKHINVSLLALQRVVKALSKKKSHVPYRDSKLTLLLRNAFGGNSRTSLIVTVSENLVNAGESLSTLRFGLDAQCIENAPIVNERRSIVELENMLSAAESKIRVQSRTIAVMKRSIKDLLQMVQKIAPENELFGENIEEMLDGLDNPDVFRFLYESRNGSRSGMAVTGHRVMDGDAAGSRRMNQAHEDVFDDQENGGGESEHDDDDVDGVDGVDGKDDGKDEARAYQDDKELKEDEIQHSPGKLQDLKDEVRRYRECLCVIPPQFRCPIGRSVMLDPVIAADGHTYDRENITEWLNVRLISPTTGLKLPHATLIPNHLLKSLIHSNPVVRAYVKGIEEGADLEKMMLQISTYIQKYEDKEREEEEKRRSGLPRHPIQGALCLFPNSTVKSEMLVNEVAASLQ
eukprot:TRINITY_DN2351_c0_g1_i1.p1 TRINITY_DN2351_c0_g1~~TRINITY_DN2351_c0_g1_i1.p1  ORF type:complete len:697 (+),score=202.31 TRINITY_DN2351_c0_g1_i1:44-2134(+)